MLLGKPVFPALLNILVALLTIARPSLCDQFCATLDKANCTVVPHINEENETIYDSYSEHCPTQQCLEVQPYNITYLWRDPETTSLHAIFPWFCYGMINYTVRVEVGTHMPPGKKEDMYAECVYNNLQKALSVYTCRDSHYWTCEECAEAYKYWVCAQSLPRCNTSKDDGYGNPYTMVRTCKGVCYDVQVKCPAYIQFACPEDDRDYHDWPNCNSVNAPAASKNFNAGATVAPGTLPMLLLLILCVACMFAW